MCWAATEKGFAKGIKIGHPCNYASGYGCQFLVVIPEKSLVIAHTVAHVDIGISHQQMGQLLLLIIAAVSQR
ncbi:MAG: hypothetical protein MJK10_11840 [Pseudomonadales bacterium]|nr:hypothetical protein [Pseudomonadales bacterium]NRA16696.1 hypothetical protein [Oceanospirillaceae bacterium]